MNVATVKLDGEKLREAIFVRDLNYKDINDALHVAHGYIQRVIRRNTISNKKMVQLEKFCGIKPEEYVLEDQDTIDSKIDPEMKKELSDLIYKAVYTAVKRAWEDD